MGSLGGRPWVKDIKAPVAIALVVVAVAAWKASNPKAFRGEDNPRSPGDDGEPSPASSGAVGTCASDPRASNGDSGGGCTLACRCECHMSSGGILNGGSAGFGVGVTSATSNGYDRKRTSGGGGRGGGETKSSNTNTNGNGRFNNTPACSCKSPCAATSAAAASVAATALVRRAAHGGTAKAAAAGTPRRGRHDRRSELNGNRRRRSRTREGSGGSVAAGAAASLAGGASVGLASAGLGRKASAGGGSAANAAAVEAAAAAELAARGATVVSVTSLRRMCHFPGAILRSGLVFERVAVLSLSGQGIGDGDIPDSVARLAGGRLRSVDVSKNRLTVVPPGLLELGGALEELNLGDNEIAEMPPEIAKLSGLRSFNMAGNRLTRVPPEVGKLSALRRLGLKGNALVRLPSTIGDLSHLVELYLTGNILEALPNEIVKLRRLKKLQLSFNNLRSLPPGMEGLRGLELCRIAVNPGLTVVPEGLAFAERLAWVSLAGTGWCARATEKRRRSSFPVIPRDEVVLGEKLGAGASGEVYAGTYRREEVAVKVFKSDVSPDGNARDELDVACALDHPNLTKALGIVRASSGAKSKSGSSQQSSSSSSGSTRGDDGVGNKQWLVMQKVCGEPLADRPDSKSVLRCRWGPGRRFEPVLVLAVLLQVARAMCYLHEKGICHGDLYAHNVLVDGETGSTVLCDFGASFFYPSERHDRNSFLLEGTEVRAFGLMARDMACRSLGCEWILQDLVPSCLQSDAGHRPSFHEIINQLHAELMQSVEPSSPMVTSAKSLHNLLDRPDIAAERGRLLSAERRQDPSAGSEAVGAVSGCSNITNGSDGGSNVDSGGGGVEGPGGSNIGVGGGGGGGVITYKRNGGAGGGVGAGGRGAGSASRPLWRLGGVQEGTADDEEGEEGEEDLKGSPAGGGGALVRVE